MSLVGNYVKIGMYIGCKAGILQKREGCEKKRVKLNTFVFKRVLFSQPLYVVSALVKPTLIPIPYRIYHPKRAGNLPIPANPPVNEWDATLQTT